MLDIFLGNPQNHLLIFSGIAIPSYAVEDDGLQHETVTINLRGPLVTTLLQSSVTVGLASIANDDTNLVIATDGVSITIDSNHPSQLFFLI